MVTVYEKVHFYDTDMMGIAHHSNHIRWFECGRVEYFKKAGVDLLDLMANGIVFPIKKITCDYISPINFDDIIAIETRLTKMTRAQMVFNFRILRKNTGEVLATGSTQNVFAHKDSGTIARLSDEQLAGFLDMYKEDKEAAK
jgi:acyl-CoA thioester hydrolase